MGVKTRLRIGLVWAGNRLNQSDPSRSVGLRRFIPLIQDRIEWFSLQKEFNSDDVELMAAHDVRNSSGELTTFSETAALIDQMDLVVTVDTAVAHLAGALGKPTWILLAHNADFRWLLGRRDSPWYPKVRLFRQPSSGDWGSPLDTIIRDEHSTDSNAMVSQGSNALKITIRSENEADHLAVEVLTREAFWNLYRPGCDEHYTTHLIRGHEDFLPDLTFVAEVDGEIVGSIMYTRSWVIDELDERVETATFGPLCVHPAWQRRGIGSALIGHSRTLAVEKGYPAIIILGDPHNYCKHGFKTGKDLGVCTLEGKYPLGLLVLELRQGFFAASRQWKFQTSEVYEFDAAQVEAYDARFPPKEKKYQYSQELFAMLVRAVVE